MVSVWLTFALIVGLLFLALLVVHYRALVNEQRRIVKEQEETMDKFLKACHNCQLKSKPNVNPNNEKN
jgi:hypothetical protein